MIFPSRVPVIPRSGRAYALEQTNAPESKIITRNRQALIFALLLTIDLIRSETPTVSFHRRYLQGTLVSIGGQSPALTQFVT